MKWILIGVVFALCALCGLLGLTAGINLNPQSTIKFVPAWGSLGDWVSGFFTAVAAATALYATRSTIKENIENFTVNQMGQTHLIGFDLVSMGRPRAQVLQVWIERIKNPEESLDIAFFLSSHTEGLSGFVEHRQAHRIYVVGSAEVLTFSQAVSNKFKGDLSGLGLRIKTSMGFHYGRGFELSEPVISEIQASIKSGEWTVIAPDGSQTSLR
ncbi:hypothetical protein GH769_14865 [Pseudomonas sp. CFSAN084952]|uniref:hypothetical protein n=1 Tax=Pseudomonas TaxID=286 RepID=UPI0012997FEB|nr:hypothetical protein [Pseudomonas sp. CFSAN084952]QGF94476.1 hypothetical protein GH769_14865 [Pseudomonas sp. CFSAN084952]